MKFLENDTNKFTEDMVIAASLINDEALKTEIKLCIDNLKILDIAFSIDLPAVSTKGKPVTHRQCNLFYAGFKYWEGRAKAALGLASFELYDNFYDLVREITRGK